MAAPSGFDSLVGRLDYPLFIVTAASGETRSGCLVGFATQCSIDPPRFLVCVSKANRTFDVAGLAGAIVVHLVPRERRDLAELFGGETGDEVDKFELCEWRAGPAGAPILSDCPSWFASSVLDRFDCGDHVCLLVEPIEADDDSATDVLGFQDARRIEPGHEA